LQILINEFIVQVQICADKAYPIIKSDSELTLLQKNMYILLLEVPEIQVRRQHGIDLCQTMEERKGYGEKITYMWATGIQ
jgi:hypothetical protein